MAGRNEHGQHAAVLLATTFVIAGGLLFCTAIIFAFSQEPFVPFSVLIGSVVALYFLMFAFRSNEPTSTQEKLGFWEQLAGRSRREKVEIRVGKRKHRKNETYGSNSPPTAESLREIRENSNEWEPKGRRSG